MADNNSLENAMAIRAKESKNFHYVEFLENLAAIKSALLKGYTARTIWQALTDEGLVTFKYSTFYKYLKKEQMSLPNQRKGQASEKDKRLAPKTIKPESVLQSTEIDPPEKAIKLKLPDGMSHNPMINPKDLI
jgi:Family of unknown function (DUF5338)